MLQICSHPGCTTFTLGALCVTHEPPVAPGSFPRGRPYVPPRPPREDGGEDLLPDVVLMEGAFQR